MKKILIPNSEELRPLMKPSSIAVVGASSRVNRGTMVIRNLKRFGFQGKVYAVNPKYKEIEDIPCYPTLADLPGPVDFVVCALGSKHVISVMKQAGKIGARAGLVIASGFGDGTGKGKGLSQELYSTCDEFGIKVCGPNCYGLLNVFGNAAPFSGAIVEPLQKGNIGFVLQSGAITRTIHDTPLGRGLGISYIVTSGNETVVELSEYVNWMLDDPQTQVIVTFIEGLKNPARFALVAEKALKMGKPIIALKVGRSVKGQRSTLAHTGSIAGSDASYEAVFQKYGVVRVYDFDELIETALLFSSSRKPHGCGFALVSISGGITGVTADLSEDIGLKLPQLEEATVKQLEEILPDFASIDNPLDTTGVVAENIDDLNEIIPVLDRDRGISAVAVAFNTPQSSESGRNFFKEKSRVLADVYKSVQKPLISFAAASGPVDPEVNGNLKNHGIPFLMGLRESLLAMHRWAWYFERQRLAELPAGRVGQGKGIARVDDCSCQGILSESESKALLKQYGITVTRQELVNNAEEAVAAGRSIGFPVVLKIDSADIPHKTEAGGVKIGIETEKAVLEAYNEIIASVSKYNPSARINGVMVQEMVPPGVEVLLGVTKDPQFGLQIAIGMGGIFVELIRSAALRPVPLAERDVEEMIDSLPLGKLLRGFRGSGPADREALIDAALALSDFAVDLGDSLSEVDINPLVVLPEGKGVIAVDSLVVFEKKAGRDKGYIGNKRGNSL